jgi:hypothetical protein
LLGADSGEDAIMPRVRTTAPLLALAVSAVAGATAQAYTPKWLACDGKVTIETRDQGKPQTQTEDVHDLYLYDDDNKNLFKHSDARKSDDIEPVTAYTDKEIRWGSKNMTISGATWEGALDRTSLALKMVYRDPDGTRTWTEQCKPAQPPS